MHAASDNFLTFKYANRELARLFGKRDKETIQTDMVSNGVEWKFMTERAPWTGLGDPLTPLTR
ncbi:hypothetical protein M514_23478 [Trichuris suis]|uniref:Uncharacterized protein n=1 Tax=Trichuris suis TaxID=68888 RepID=A0A085N4B4_9BILA|nr:hypothetical protein M514_23478 [Trichuris suis]